jgi:oligopeptide/dipeptide ABC transporter ATP-binding protein
MARDDRRGGPVLELRDASVTYRGDDGAPFEAVTRASLALWRGQILGLVGESGCGKSTTARAMMGLQPLSTGELRLHGEPAGPGSRSLRSSVQAIFQDPAGSFNPKRSLLDSVAEPLRVWRQGDKNERRRRALAELERVGITASTAERLPHEVSGGQCQRAAIARATILRPEVLICDEPVSALDVSIQAQILELLAELRREQGLAMLFISHDLSVVATLCDRTAVMYAGAVVEQAPTVDVASAPRHPYTVILHDSIPSPDVDHEPVARLAMTPRGPVTDGRQLPGCRFAGVCPRATPECDAAMPPLVPHRTGHEVACLHPFAASPGCRTSDDEGTTPCPQPTRSG